MIFDIVPDNKKGKLRNSFVEAFVNTSTEYYKKYISNLKEYPDGLCYDGYLWDSLKVDYEQVESSMEDAIQYLKEKDTVYVMWDIYSLYRVAEYRILTNKYPKDTIIKTDSLELCKFILDEWKWEFASDNQYLPEDIYIFDETMKWFVIFTHETYDSSTKPDLDDNDYIRLCFLHDTTN